MKLKILTLIKTEKGTVNLPKQFDESVRSDLIKKAVLALHANARQRYGTYRRAGLDFSAKVSRRRRDYRGSYGHGISRVPRKVLSRSGTHFNWEGAVAPGTKGGRRAHPPKASKIWEQKINKKENRKAIRSAMAATLVKALAESRGHKVPQNYPFAIESKIESVSKTKELLNHLEKLGFGDELGRATKKIRAGKGKLRNRRYKKTRGMLIITSKACELTKAASNIIGLEVVDIKSINAELLAPGTIPGRMTIFTDSAIELLEKEKLFAEDKPKPIKEEKESKKNIKKQAEKTEAQKTVKKAVKKTAAKKVSKK